MSKCLQAIFILNYDRCQRASPWQRYEKCKSNYLIPLYLPPPIKYGHDEWKTKTTIKSKNIVYILYCLLLFIGIDICYLIYDI